MDYLNTTIKYLDEENKQLKERLKRMTDLNEIVNQQRSCQEKDYLVRFHQEEINVIREIGLENQQGLKKEVGIWLCRSSYCFRRYRNCISNFKHQGNRSSSANKPFRTLAIEIKPYSCKKIKFVINCKTNRQRS